MDPILLFTDSPSVYHVMLDPNRPKRRCCAYTHSGTRCANRTPYTDKHFKARCGIHLDKYDRVVSVCECRLISDMTREYRKLRETTMRDELNIFPDTHTCSVCLSVIHANTCIITSCQHHFHEDCLNEWLYVAHKDTCPNCRTVLRDNTKDLSFNSLTNLYSVFDVIDSESVRDRLRESALDIRHLTDRIYDYDVAVEMALIFNGIH